MASRGISKRLPLTSIVARCVALFDAPSTFWLHGAFQQTERTLQCWALRGHCNCRQGHEGESTIPELGVATPPSWHATCFVV